MAFLTLYWILDVFLIFLCAFAVVYLYMTRNFDHWKKKGVTEIRPVPFVGSFLDYCLFRNSPGFLFKSWYDRGTGLPYLGFYIFDKPALLLRDPDIIKAVMVKDFNYFMDRYVSTHKSDTIAAGNMFLAKSREWKSMRQSSTSIFTSGKMKGMFPLMTTIGRELVTYLDGRDLQGDGQSIEMKELSGAYTTDVIMSCAFGLQTNSFNDPNSEFRKCSRNVFSFGTYLRSMEFAGFFFAPNAVKLLNLKYFSTKFSDFMRSAFTETMRLRIESGVTRNDLVDLLIQNRFQKDDPEVTKFDTENLVGQAATFFAAGSESSSSLMAFTLYELALQPNIQSRLRKEINSALEDSAGEITYEMVMNLSYLDMITSETLRKYPFLPFLERVATSDYRVPGTDLVIERGTPVYIPLIGLQYDPEYYSDPEKYDPERFSTDNKQKRPSCAYVPFGEGPRNCVGLRFGLLQSKLGIIKFLLNYEVSPCPRTAIPIRFDPKALLLSSKDGLYLNVRKVTGERPLKANVM